MGALVISPVVYVELRAYPTATEAIVDRFLEANRIEIDWLIEREIWELAAERFERYANRRRRQGGGEAKRLTSDFLIAAHAIVRADRLITLDQRRYRADFPELTLVEP
jgi:predicted nucleic acid-binding protein